MSNDNASKDRELVLALNQYALIQDATKGQVTVYVGPNKASLSNTDQPVQFAATNRFERCSLEQAIKEFPLVAEGSYVVLQNPSEDEKSPHPTSGAHTATKLKWGRKINVPGPTTFALWPGQVAQVIEGHRLRSNQYVLVRVYDEVSARANVDKMVVKRAAAPSDSGQRPSTEGETPAAAGDAALTVKPEEIVIGKLFVIKGTDVSFFIPPTGMEVVQDDNGRYVREAVTLERLEYCILLDENGKKSYVRGPMVVFPEPTQVFVTREVNEDGGQVVSTRKFKARELNNDMGIFVKVIADYEEGGRQFKVGEELFITGKEQRIYYPREEHAIIKYGDRELTYAVVIPAGEGRYVLDKNVGAVELLTGPKMLLPDPRTQVIVRRVLEDGQVQLWFPGNTEAREYNAKLREIVRASGEQTMERALSEDKIASHMPPVRRLASSAFAGDDFQRGKAYTPPRTLTLDTKYEGAVQINVWNGYAVMVVSKTGKRRVVKGPETVLLGYDESLLALELSTGKPKTTDKLERTSYLRVLHNHVSDIVNAFTKDMVRVTVKLSYRVNFEGDSQKWFDVENYVKFLCDHMRSLLKNAIKKVGVEEFNQNAIDIVRDTVLGAKSAEAGQRASKAFAENGMHVYEVEVLETTIGDEAISRLLSLAQHATVQQALQVAEAERNLANTKRLETIQQGVLEARETTALLQAQLEVDRIARDLELATKRLQAEAVKAAEQLKATEAQQGVTSAISSAELERVKQAREQELAFMKTELDQRIAELEAEAKTLSTKAGAVTPQMVAALQAFGNQFIAVEAAKAMSPLAILGGESVSDVLGKLLKGTALEGVLKNGKGHALPAGDQPQV